MEILLQVVIIACLELSINGLILILNPVLVSLAHLFHLSACPERPIVLLHNQGSLSLFLPLDGFLLVMV